MMRVRTSRAAARAGARGHVAPLFLSGTEAVAVLRSAKRGLGALTYGWLLPDQADPTGERLAIIVAALKQYPHIQGLFWDQATLYQPPRSEQEDASFYRALNVMPDLYASAVGTTVLQVRDIPSCPDEFERILCLGTGFKQLRRGGTNYGIRAVWCDLKVRKAPRRG